MSTESVSTANKRKWWMLAAMGAVLGIVLLDETVVSVALPTMQTDLGMSSISSHWIINAYLLVFAGFAAAAGKLGDIFGLSNMMATGLVLFALSSIACGFADDGTMLIVARATQGIGAAIIFPISLAILSRAFPPHQLGFALGIYGSIGTVFLALGPLIGGFLTDTLSWRWIFWVNPPVVLAVLAIILIARTPQPKLGARPRIDFLGLVLLVSGLGLFVFALMQAPELGWRNPVTLLALFGGLGLLLAFAIVERRIAQPLIDIELFSSAPFRAAGFIIFMAQFSKIALIVFGALYFQRQLGMDPFVAGLALLPAVGGNPLTAAPMGWLTDRVSPRKLVLLGLTMTGASLLWIGLYSATNNYWLLLPGLIVWGLSVALLFLPPNKIMLGAVAPEKQGLAGGIVMSSQLIGGTVGMAVCSTLFHITQNYGLVFIVTAALLFVAFAVSWISIKT